MSKLISELMTAVETKELNEIASIANMSAKNFLQLGEISAVTALQLCMELERYRTKQ